MKNLVLISIVLISASCFGQMTPTSAQHRKLMEHRAKIVKLQNEITRLQAELSFEISQLQLTSARIVIENRWPSTTQFNAQTFGFMEPAAPAISAAPLSSLPTPPPPSNGPVSVQQESHK